MPAGVDQDRVRDTWVLCETLLDHLPQARQSSGALGNLSGLAGGRLVPCPRCGARGRVTAKGNPCASCIPKTSASEGRLEVQGVHGCSRCVVCDGVGWRKRRAGEPEWDEYAAVEMAPPPTGLLNEVKQALALEKERPGLRDVALRRADRVLQEMTGVTHEEPWADSWRRKCRQGSYRELQRALERLRDSEEARYRVIWRLVILDDGTVPNERIAAFLNESMVVLASMMPDRIKLPRHLTPEEGHRARKASLWHGKTVGHVQARQERNREIQRLRYVEGWKVKRIARHYGLSEMQVKRIAPPALPVATSV